MQPIKKGESQNEKLKLNLFHSTDRQTETRESGFPITCFYPII